MDNAAELLALFEGHAGAHGTHGEPSTEFGKLKWEIKTTARTIREPVTVELWRDHLAGKRPLGVVPIRQDGTCVWGSIDVDQYDDDHHDLIGQVEKRELPLVPCRSKSGGLHLFLFLTEPQPAVAVQAILRDCAALLGIAGSEIFPKQTRVLSERGDVGNWMVMPYFGSTYGGKLKAQVGMRAGGIEMPIEEFIHAAKLKRVEPEQLAKVGTAPTKRAKKHDPKELVVLDFGDGPPCLQHLRTTGGFAEPGRNSSLFMIGIYLKRRFPANWRLHLEHANQELMRPPVKAEELIACTRSLEKREYEYTCKVEPMCSHCDSQRCRGRRYGVGDGGNIPEITSISKLDTAPPIWFVDVSGKRLELSTEELSTYQLFQKRALDATNVFYSAMKNPVWTSMLQAALQNLTLIEAPPDIHSQSAFHEQLEEFLTNRRKGQRKEDVLSGRPWEDAENDRHVFRMADLARHLEKEKFRNERGGSFTRGQLSRLIESAGGVSGFVNIKGKGVRVWSIPRSAIETMDEADLPDSASTKI